MKIVFNYNEHRISYYFRGEGRGRRGGIKKKKRRSDVSGGKSYQKNLRERYLPYIYINTNKIRYFQQKDMDIAIIVKESGHETKI